MTLHEYLKKVYNKITPKVVQSWIIQNEDDRGILRRLDYAYGLVPDVGEPNPQGTNPNDRNSNGLLRILKSINYGKNPEIEYFIQRVEETCNTIKDLHCLFLVADYEQFHQDTTTFLHRFYSQMNDPSKALTMDMPNLTPFFRMRELEPQEDTNDAILEFFHVPFKKRYLMGTYRYSIPGYPSLYGSSSVYAAWEEMGRKTITNYGYTAYSTIEPIRLLDLRWIFNKDITKYESCLKHYILRLPIIIACSMRVLQSSDRFVPEYIFSQQVFQWLMSLLKKNPKSPMGVLYTSTKFSIWEAFCKKEIMIAEMTNYALLAYTTAAETADYSESLAAKLKVRIPYWYTNEVSAQTCPYAILKEIQTTLMTHGGKGTNYRQMKRCLENDKKKKTINSTIAS